jgi:hypothetical protein
VDKDQWVAMFREIGLAEEIMMKWCRMFETRFDKLNQGAVFLFAYASTDYRSRPPNYLFKQKYNSTDNAFVYEKTEALKIS